MDLNIDHTPDDPYNGIPSTEKTFVKYLQDSGYRTGVVGKWHVGSGPGLMPLDRGFDYFYGIRGGGDNYWNASLWENTSAVEHDGTYLTYLFSDKAADFIAAENDDPFFLYLAYNAPHGPPHAPEDLIEKYSHIDNEKRRIYLAMVDAVDQGVGQVMTALDDSGKRSDTLVFFLSDHGGADSTTDSLDPSNAPWRGGKSSLYDGGTRVPFVGSWPAQWPSGVTYDEQVISLDIGATAMALAGVEADENRPLHGVNLNPYVLGTASDVPHEVLFWRRWRDNFDQMIFAARTKQAKIYKFARADDVEYYDLINDPGEETDLANNGDSRSERSEASGEALERVERSERSELDQAR